MYNGWKRTEIGRLYGMTFQTAAIFLIAKSNWTSLNVPHGLFHIPYFYNMYLVSTFHTSNPQILDYFKNLIDWEYCLHHPF